MCILNGSYVTLWRKKHKVNDVNKKYGGTGYE